MSFFVLPILLIVGVLSLSIYLSRANWPYHPALARGYITDMLIYYFAPLAPMLVSLLGFNLVVMVNPALESDNARITMLVVGLAGLFITRRLPPIKAAQDRVRAARLARYEAQQK